MLRVEPVAGARGFHEKAGPCQDLFTRPVRNGRRRPTGGASGFPVPFLFRKGFGFPPPTRPASIRTVSGAVSSGASWSP